MASRSRFPYHRRLLVLLLAFSWTLVACFVTFQYSREKQFKAQRLDAHLQVFNRGLLDAMVAGSTPDAYLATHAAPYADLRITVIDAAGRVVYDSSAEALPASNHLDRPEVADALAHGTGFTIRRVSESLHRDYFYSAMRDYFYSAMRGDFGNPGGGAAGGASTVAGAPFIVRSAVPYTLPLVETLAADSGFLWSMFGLALLMSFAGWFVTRRLGQTISRLNDIAAQAEIGERIDTQVHFPHDELGDISRHITHLYARLQQTTADRDREHALALHAEQEKIRIKKQLTNNINHELKTPVAAVRGYLETLLSNPGLSIEQRTAFLEKSLAQSQRLSDLLQDVSTITRMDEAGELIRRESVVLNDLVADIAAEMKLRPESQRLRVNCSFTHALRVEGSPSLLSSIFRNLANNAAVYSGGRDIFIDLVSEDAESYTLRFADNGIGVEERCLPYLFERFYRIDSGRSRNLGGTGLGLSIVKNAVLIHGGTITVCNGARGGLEFEFSLRKLHAPATSP